MNPFTWIKNQSLFGDRRAVALLILSFMSLLALIVYSLSVIESREFKIPIRYSGYREGNLSDRGQWFSLLALPLFAVVSFAFNAAISLRVHDMRPQLSQVLLVLNLVVLVFTFFISQALFELL